MTIRVGFLGAGLISNFHLFTLADCGIDHDVVAVHDPDTDRAERWAAAHGADAVGEDELFEAVDAVYVAAWTSEHPRLVAKAADAGVAVFCEKPLAFDAATAATMVDTVAGAGVVNQVGLVLRAFPPFRLLRRLLADEDAGQVLAVVFRDDQYLPVQGLYASTWRTDPARCGRGVLLEHSIHDVDMLEWLLGPARSLSATSREVHGFPGIDDVVAARLDFAAGATATLSSVWHDILERASDRHVEVFCERMQVVIEHDFDGPVRWQVAGEEPGSVEGSGLVAELAARGDTDLNPARAFLAAVEAGTPASPSLADALPAHRLVDALYDSAARGGAVIDLPREAPGPAAR